LKEHIQRQMGEGKARHSIRHKKGIGTVIGTVVSLAIIAFILINIMVWTSNVGAQMRQFDAQGLEEKIAILDVSFSSQQIKFTLKNTGSKKVHIVSLWVVNFTAPTNHSRHTLNLYISSGETTTYTLDRRWTNGDKLLFKFITELGRAFSIQKEATTISVTYPSLYAMISGSYVSGNLPTDVQTVDSAYFVTKTEATAYSKNAFCAYRSSPSLNIPRYRIWNGSEWGSQNQLDAGLGPVRWVRVAYCPISSRSYEKIVITITDNGYLAAYVWTGSSWSVTSNIGSTGTTANAYRCFDIAYEKTSGKALLVYSTGFSTNEIGYKTWDGTQWSGESLKELRTTGIVYWIALASKPTTNANEIAMIYIDSNNNVHGYVWTGSAWSEMGQSSVWDTSAADGTKECIAVAYEETSGEAMFVWADTTTTDFYYRTWDGTTLTGPTLLDIADAGDRGNWLTLKSDPASDDLFLTVVTNYYNPELETAYWSGSGWTVHTERDSDVDTAAARCADFEWEPSGSTGLLIWGTASGSLEVRKFTPPNSWTTLTDLTAAGTHPWIQLRRNPNWASGDIKILGAMLNSAFDIGAMTWDGSTLTNLGDTTFTGATTVTTYECFEIGFSFLSDPTEFTVDTQFEFSGIAGIPTKLEWTIVSKYNASSVSVTIGLWNYNSGDWNDTYTYTSSGTADTEETKTITIVTNVGYYTSSGNAKIHIKAVKSTSTSFQQKLNQIKLTYW